MKKSSLLKFAAVVLFVLLFVFGLRLAALKPLWNDELYSQIYSVEKLSYSQILLGHVPEGNNSPLFYILQKGVCDMTHFQLPFVWKGQWSIAQPQAQLTLRLMPNFFMSLALAIIFYMFAKQYSSMAGVYAFLTALSSSAVWVYWVEARPYALWFTLSLFQLLYFLQFICQKDKRLQAWQKLTVVHIFLSLTAVFGAVQVFIVSLLLFGFYEKKLTRYLLILFLPLAFGFYYFLNAPHYVFCLPPDPGVLIWENFSVERLLLVLLCGIFALSAGSQNKKQSLDVLLPYGILVALFFGAVLGIMVCFAMTTQPNWKGFMISSRYFIFLAPLGIVSTVVFLFEVFKKLAREPWMIINFSILAAGLLVLRSLKVIIEIFALGIY